jgi:serine/threonine protein kinase
MAVTGDLTRYRYISRIGAGGMARVDLAEDTLLGRRVALKRMAGAAEPQGLSRLRREALAGASLSHPNLVSIYDAVTSEDGDLVIVMEYVPGGTLRDALNRRRRLPADEAVRMLEGVAAGLDAIHTRGIIHRDVKPSNILLGESGAVKVADLGIAAIPDRTRITASGSVLGSLSYMAPEQLDSARSTPATDVYALGAVAYEMLSGEKARNETNPVTLAHAIATQRPPNLLNAWPEAPPAAADVLVQAMAHDPAERPRSAGELVGRLRDALAPVPAAWPRPRPEDRPTTSVAPGAAQGRRSRSGPLVAALLALVAAVVVLAVLLNSGGSRSPASNRAAAGGHHAAAHRPGTAARSSTAGTTSAGASSTTPPASASTPSAGASSATPPASASTPSAGASSATPPASASTPSAGASSATPPASASTPSAGASSATPPASAASATGPVGAVESFYGAAAAHHYAGAWALADPTLRSQLQGYESFQAGQAGDHSITFDSAHVISQSSRAATVAVQTTSVRDSGTQHCTGTVDLVPAGGGGWLLHLLHINCT